MFTNLTFNKVALFRGKTAAAITILILADVLSSVFGGQCRFHTSNNDYVCELHSARFLESADDFTITGEHLPNFSNSNVTAVHTSMENPSNLRLIPSVMFEIFPNLRTIDLTRSQMEIIVGLQNCIRLEHIILSSNAIQSIQSAAFSNCSNLIEIDVSINRINEIHANAFMGLNALRRIRLNNNTISTLLPGTFNAALTIEMIELHTNNLDDVPANVFHNLPSLSTLNLHSNRITRIQSNAFNNLPQLGTIWLNQNVISVIDADAFVSTGGLYLLYLQNNLITRLSSQTFGTITSQLRGIFAASNRIIAIEPNFFQIGIRIEVFNIVDNLCANIAVDPRFSNIPITFELCFRNWEDGTEITTTTTTIAPTTTPVAPGTALKTTIPKIGIIFFVLLAFAIIR